MSIKKNEIRDRPTSFHVKLPHFMQAAAVELLFCNCRADVKPK